MPTPPPGGPPASSRFSDVAVASALASHRADLAAFLQVWGRRQDEVLGAAVQALADQHRLLKEPVPQFPEDALTSTPDVTDPAHCLRSDSKEACKADAAETSGSGAEGQAGEEQQLCASASEGQASQPKGSEQVRQSSEEFASDRYPVRTNSQYSASKMLKGTMRRTMTLQDELHRKGQLLGLEKKLFKKKSASKLRSFTTSLVEQVSDIKESEFSIRNMVKSKHFEFLCATMIMFNAVVIGYAADYAFQNMQAPTNITIDVLEGFFFVFYLTEICLRIYAQRCRFFTGEDCYWNVFDFFLVLTSMIEPVQGLMQSDQGDASSSSMTNLSFLRLARLIKMVKLLRVIRIMRMFRELRLVLNSILGSVKAMLWAIVIIISTTYMFSIAIFNGCSGYVESGVLSGEPQDEQVRSDIDLYWSSVGQAMLTLFWASTSGESWRYIAAPLWDVGVVFYIIFLMYITFFFFVVTNTLTSLFVENTIAQAEKDHELVIQQEMTKKDQYIDRLRTMYEMFDTDGDGNISYDEFCEHLSSPELHAFAASLDIDTLDTKQFFHVLSAAGTQPVDLESFVVGCIKLKGSAKSMDLMDLMISWRKSYHEVELFNKWMVESIYEIKRFLLAAEEVRKLETVAAA